MLLVVARSWCVAASAGVGVVVESECDRMSKEMVSSVREDNSDLVRRVISINSVAYKNENNNNNNVVVVVADSLLLVVVVGATTAAVAAAVAVTAAVTVATTTANAADAVSALLTPATANTAVYTKKTSTTTTTIPGLYGWDHSIALRPATQTTYNMTRPVIGRGTIGLPSYQHLIS
ncbi:antifreeze protein Maxi-like [Vespula maculifrons]|uniref:Antifreeze protein Maxi-like n=1 Tax=Vespula maculifrons TaxID=7453 RepID=A0ABD2CRN2_VESMC